MTESSIPKKYTFYTDSIYFKSEQSKTGKKYYVEGYISTEDLDAYNDIVSKKAMEDMITQIQSRNITLDYDHEAWRENNTILPVGKVVEAKLDDTGLWVKCQLNPASPKFKNLWGSIKGGFVNAFSIAYKPIKTVIKTVDGIKARILESVELLNVALTGAPVNSNAKLTGFDMKSVMLKSINEMEESKMTEEQIENKSQDSAPVEEPKKEESSEESSEPSEPVEEKACKTPEKKKMKEEDEEEEDKKKPEQKSEPVKNEEMEKILAEMKSMKDRLEKSEAELKSLKEKPVMKGIQEQTPETKSATDRKNSVLQFI